MADDDIATHDLTDLGELCGCTTQQRKLAEGLLAGLSQTEAAHRAGYKGGRDSSQLRSAASQAAQTSPVKALLALAESKGLGVPNSPGDREELVRILWAHARSKDKQSSIRASVELERLQQLEADNKPGMSLDELIREMLNYGAGLGIVASLYLDQVKQRGPHMKLAGLPLFKQMAPAIAREFPDIYARLVGYLDECCRADALEMAAAAPVPVENLVVRRLGPDGRYLEDMENGGAGG
jgi:hypothetical protein